jgi:hypothetical protein
MIESKFTPGPWGVVAGDNYMIESEYIPGKYPHRFPGDDMGPFVAFVGNRQADFGEADARLIAAAPDLLAAREAFVEADCQDGASLAFSMAVDAIAKARVVV